MSLTGDTYHIEIAYSDPVPPAERNELVKRDWGIDVSHHALFKDRFWDYKDSVTKRKGDEAPKIWGFLIHVEDEDEVRSLVSKAQRFVNEPVRPGSMGNPRVVRVSRTPSGFYHEW